MNTSNAFEIINTIKLITYNRWQHHNPQVYNFSAN